MLNLVLGMARSESSKGELSVVTRVTNRIRKALASSLVKPRSCSSFL
jgi:hypothetical protein